MTEADVQRALARWVQWWNVIAITNLVLEHEIDFAVITRAGYLREYEIKVTQSDWNRDYKKDERPPTPEWIEQMDDRRKAHYEKYVRPRRSMKRIRRFTYVYASGLVAPDWVPEWAGLIEATANAEGVVRLTEHRVAKDRRVEKLSDRTMQTVLRRVYYRWAELAYRNGLLAPPEGDTTGERPS